MCIIGKEEEEVLATQNQQEKIQQKTTYGKQTGHIYRVVQKAVPLF